MPEHIGGAAADAAKRIRVLIADDSVFMRKTIERIVNETPGCIVVGTAVDGVEAVQMAVRLRPDVITMDVEMPRMDGVTAVAELMKTVPTPVVMVSTLTAAGAATSIRALEAGAVECVAKPGTMSADLISVADRLSAAILRAATARPRRMALPPRPLAAAPTKITPIGRASERVVVIGSSTGGPPALSEVIPHLPGDLPAGVVVIQHMPPGFTAALARRLDGLSPLHVSEAVEGDIVAAGRVLVAPGDYHLTITRDHRVHLEQGPSMHGVRPAADIALKSVAEVYGRQASVAILTGMGRDGAEGAAAVERAGGHIVVQDEATCVVYGMPRVTRELTSNADERPIQEIARALTNLVLKGSAR